jgi:hypothetical protein
VLHELPRIQSTWAILKCLTQAEYSTPILNNFLRCIKEFNIIELTISSRYRTKNTDRVMQDVVPEVSSERNETTYVKSEIRAWSHEICMHMMSIPTSKRIVLLCCLRCYTLTTANTVRWWLVSEARLLNQLGWSFVLIHRTRYVVLISLTTTRDITRHLLEGVNVLVN